MSRDFSLQIFFNESSSSKPLKITLGSFQILSKIRGDICKSRCTTDINDTGGKFAPPPQKKAKLVQCLKSEALVLLFLFHCGGGFVLQYIVTGRQKSGGGGGGGNS